MMEWIMKNKSEINGNTECDIEVQLVSNDNITERFLYYWAKMYAANLKIGDKYSDLRKTISIIILDDDFKLKKILKDHRQHGEYERVKQRILY